MSDNENENANEEASIAPPRFALVPSAMTGIIDYSTRQGLDTYRANTRSLYNNPEDAYDLESVGLQTFLGLLAHRAKSADWDFDVPVDLGDPIVGLLDFLDNHGQFTLEHLVDFSKMYLDVECRAAQLNMQIVNCIQHSLSLPGFRKINTWREQWHVGGTPAALPLIKVIIREAFIDTNATSRILREHLSSLPAKLSELKGDIVSFNAFVMTTLDQLRARGQTTSDLLSNLFKGYLSSEDRTFVAYIEKKQEEFDDGTTFTHTSLMNLAANKYKTLVQSGKWMAMSDSDKKILALETKISKFGKKGDTPAPKAAGNSNSNRSTNNPGKASTPGKKATPEWMSRHPGAAFIAAGKPKTVDGKKYWWCPKHKRFVQHKPSECRMNAATTGNVPTTSSNTTAPPTSSGNNAPPPSLRVSTALLMNE
jgi:hypothetical protein